VARIAFVEPQAAPAEVKHLYEHRLGGRPANIHKAMAHNPQGLTAFIALYASIGASLDRKLWEMVYLRISFLNDCYYCSQHHMNFSKKVGLGPHDWRALKSGDIARYNQREQAAVRYAEKLTRTPASVTDANVNELKTHFTDQQISDLHLLIGMINMGNRFTGPLALDLEIPAIQI
jgi:uncharacterized peroxidase-related enzyme